MRRTLIITSLLGSLVIFALTIDLFDAIFMFVFFGVTPFRAEPIPAVQMLLVYSLTASVIIVYALRGRIESLRHSLARKATHANVS